MWTALLADAAANKVDPDPYTYVYVSQNLPESLQLWSNGQVQSFAVASLISWRGEWYVVHLGPNPRPANVGTVDMPATGPGTPGPPGGC